MKKNDLFWTDFLRRFLSCKFMAMDVKVLDVAAGNKETEKQKRKSVELE